MKITTSDKIIAYLTLLSGLAISGVAEYYSIMGLIAIYPAAVVPIIVMGVVLGFGKIVGTVWLKQNWAFAPWFLRAYILPAITVLMIITSLGVFGFLSKAHSDQSLVSGDVQSKIAVYDTKIQTAKENIDANRKALKQMDEAVDQVMGRSSSETGADKAVAIRRGQQKERSRLQSEIATEQKTISQLSEERAPIAAEVRKVEAEVGPIKYIAHLLYGENPDANILEKAVIWVTVLIVIVLDPLAVILLLASQFSFQRFRQIEEEDDTEEDVEEWFRQGKERARQLDEEAAAGIIAQEVANVLPEAVVMEEVVEPTPVIKEHVTVTDADKLFENAPSGDISSGRRFNIDVTELTPYPFANELVVEDQDEVDEADPAIHKAMTAWKAANPESSLKLQRRLLEAGKIDKLPWEEYLQPEADFSDLDAAAEAAKWAQEQLDERPGDYVSQDESKKKGSDMDGEAGHTADPQSEGGLGYVQNAEQTPSSIWQRVKKAKGDL